MPKVRKETWHTLIVLAVSVPVAVVIGIVVFISVTSTPLHPNSKDIPSVTRSASSPRWAAAVEEGRKLVRASLVEQNVPGLSVAIGLRGDIVWAEGFGWADLKDHIPVAPETRFRIGHASKPLTSAAVGLLVEKGRMRLDDEIQTDVPAFPRKQWPVTLRQLMGHMAGVRHYDDMEWGDKPSIHCDRAAEGLQSFANDPLLFEPGTQYRAISMYGWVLVSAAVEAAADEPFSTFMRTKIFVPLGMTATTSDSSTEPAPDRATPYYQDRFNRLSISAVDYSCFAGAGAFLSTPSDLVRFGMAINTGQLLQPATVRMLQTRQLLRSGKETDYGLGWMLDTVELAGEPVAQAGHAGRILLGGTTSLLTFPARGMAVVVMANISLANTKAIATSLAQIFAER